jgi:hypothetical protein
MTLHTFGWVAFPLLLVFSAALGFAALHWKKQVNSLRSKLQLSEHGCHSLSDALTIEKLAHARTTQSLAAERDSHAETTRLLGVEREEHARTKLALADACAKVEELDTVGREMLPELRTASGNAAYFSVIVPFLEKELSRFVSRAASMKAQHLAEEKRELGARVLELLIGFFFPGKLRPTPHW